MRPAVWLERVERRVDHVDPEPAVVEGHAAVDEHDLAALLEHEAVHSDLAEAAERHDAHHGAIVVQEGLFFADTFAFGGGLLYT